MSAPADLAILSRWRSLLFTMGARYLTPRTRLSRWVAYTAAAASSSILCALLFDPAANSPTIHTSRISRRPVVWGYLFRLTARIIGLELLAIAAFIEESPPRRPNSCLWLYVDNNNALEASARGGSPTDIAALLVARIWETLTRFNIRDWFPRVHSTPNPADLPTRRKIPPYPTIRSRSFTHLSMLFSSSRRALRLISPSITGPGTNVKQARKPLNQPCQHG